MGNKLNISDVSGSTKSPTLDAFESEIVKSMGKLMESMLSFSTDEYVSPLERYGDGEFGLPSHLFGSHWRTEKRCVYTNFTEYKQVQYEMSDLSIDNPFAVCGHESRISHIVGWGHTYSFVSKTDDSEVELIDTLVESYDNFERQNRWSMFQIESLYRRDRDGVCVVRFFEDQDQLQVRHLEIESLEPDLNNAKKYPFGIVRDSIDFDKITGYLINNEPIGFAEIQLRTRKADRKHQLGIPLFYAARKNLRAAMKIMRNTTALSEIQSAIGMIRKFKNAVSSAVDGLVKAKSNMTVTNNAPGFGNSQQGNTRQYERFGPGSIINTNLDTEYEFPANHARPEAFVPIVQMELRAAGASVCMPEYMFTADASNSNYSSTKETTEPALIAFERSQWEEIEFNRQIIEKWIEFEIQKGRLPVDTLQRIKIQIEPPQLRKEDPLKKAQTDQIYLDKGIKSIQTVTLEAGCDYEIEQANIEAHKERNGDLIGNSRPPIDDFPIIPNRNANTTDGDVTVPQITSQEPNSPEGNTT